MNKKQQLEICLLYVKYCNKTTVARKYGISDTYVGMVVNNAVKGMINRGIIIVVSNNFKLYNSSVEKNRELWENRFERYFNITV